MGTLIFGMVVGGIIVAVVLTMTKWGQDFSANIKKGAL